MKIIELIINEDDLLFGVQAISLVDRPAIESSFIALKEQPVLLAEMDKDKRLLLGAALIPDKPILRLIGDEEVHVFFSKNTIRRVTELFFQNGNQAEWTIDHEHKVSGLSVVESWIVEDKEKDKSAIYGIDVPVGTWMISVKCENEAIWDQLVKEGIVKGFSIEGMFDHRYETRLKEDLVSEKLYSDLEKLMSSIADKDENKEIDTEPK